MKSEKPSTDNAAQRSHVYLRDVLAQHNDSLSKILAQIPPGSCVLDVGTGSGALGRQLASMGGFVVDGLTYNEEEAALARPHYRELVVQDLEREPLPGRLGTQQYDVVVCADVLEHLRNASDVLRALRAMLRPGGVVLVSLPNVTHLGVLLGLMAGRFVRTREGLLDATHVHFMDRTALRCLAQAAGFAVAHEDAVRRNLVDTEFAKLDFQALPQAVRSYLLAVPDSDVYQFVWALRPDGLHGDLADLPAPASQDPPAVPVIEQVPRFRTQLFLDRGQGLIEKDCVEAYGMQTPGLQTLSFPIDDGASVRALRLDFSDRPGQIEFVSLVALAADGKTVWAWNGDWAANQSYHQCDWTGVRGWWGGRVVRATGDDPWVALPLNAGAWSGVARLELCMGSPQAPGASDLPGVDAGQLQGLLQTVNANLQALTAQTAQRVAVLEQQSASAQSLADFRQGDIDTLRRELAAAQGLADFRQGDIASLRGELAAVQGLADFRQSDIDTLRRELAAVQGLADFRQSDIDTLRVELAAAQGLADFRQTDIDTLRSELTATLAVAAVLQSDLAGLRADLEAALAQANERQERLDAMLTSRSWRFTAGLRWITQWLSRGSRR
jgi:2-polyprenyl-3-methyl-5-hydroxy-6-metoxy-1,4-benzoquinol methylase